MHLVLVNQFARSVNDEQLLSCLPLIIIEIPIFHINISHSLHPCSVEYNSVNSPENISGVRKTRKLKNCMKFNFNIIPIILDSSRGRMFHKTPKLETCLLYKINESHAVDVFVLWIERARGAFALSKLFGKFKYHHDSDIVAFELWALRWMNIRTISKHEIKFHPTRDDFYLRYVLMFV